MNGNRLEERCIPQVESLVESMPKTIEADLMYFVWPTRKHRHTDTNVSKRQYYSFVSRQHTLKIGWKNIKKQGSYGRRKRQYVKWVRVKLTEFFRGIRIICGEMWSETSMQTQKLSCQANRCQTLGHKSCSGRKRQCHLLHMSFFDCSQYWSVQHLGPKLTDINAVSYCQTCYMWWWLTVVLLLLYLSSINEWTKRKKSALKNKREESRWMGKIFKLS